MIWSRSIFKRDATSGRARRWRGAEGGRSLRQRLHAEALDLADKPEPVQEAVRFTSPRRPAEPMVHGNVLGQRGEIGIECLPDRFRLG